MPTGTPTRQRQTRREPGTQSHGTRTHPESAGLPNAQEVTGIVSIERTERVVRAALLASLAVIVIGVPAFAGKPNREISSGFTVDDGRYATTTVAHRGSSGATWAHAKCFQNGTIVYEQWVKFGTSTTATFTLGPTPSWSSGGATCTGEEGWWQSGTRWRVLGTDSFTAAG